MVSVYDVHSTAEPFARGLNNSMGTVINLNEYKLKRQVTTVVQSVCDLMLYFMNLFITYVINPTIAATVTVQRKRVTVI